MIINQIPVGIKEQAAIVVADGCTTLGNVQIAWKTDRRAGVEIKACIVSEIPDCNLVLRNRCGAKKVEREKERVKVLVAGKD